MFRKLSMKKKNVFIKKHIPKVRSNEHLSSERRTKTKLHDEVWNILFEIEFNEVENLKI